MSKIIIKFKDVVRQEIPLVNPITTIGRNPTNDIHIDNLAVSRFHSQIVREGDHFSIEDLNSNNGTFVNGQKVINQVLKDGDSIIVGKHTLVFSTAELGESFRDSPATFSTGTSSESEDLDGTFMLDAKVQQSMLQNQKAAAALADRGKSGTSPAGHAPAPSAQPLMGLLKVVRGNLDRSTFELVKPATTIGKDSSADIQAGGFLTGAIAMVINRSGSDYSVTGAGGFFKPKYNGGKLESNQKLKEGDTLDLAGFTFQFTYKR